MGYGGRRLAVMTALALLILTVTGCGGRTQESADAGTADSVYVPEFTLLENAREINVYGAVRMEDSLYYSSLDYHPGQERAGQYICHYSLSQGQVVQEIFVSDHCFEIDDFRVGEDGSVYVALMENEENDCISRLYAFDAKGNRKWETSLGVRSMGVRLVVDGQGRVCVFLPDGIAAVYGNDGKPTGNVQLGVPVYRTGTDRDGRVFVCYMEDGKPLLSEFDPDSMALGDVYQGFPDGKGGQLIAGASHDFLVQDYDGFLYGYDLETQTAEKILSWRDLDIGGDTVGTVWPSGDGGALALLRSESPGMGELASLVRKDPSEVPEKQEIEIAVYGSAYTELENAVAAFNRRSENTRVVIREYPWDFNNMQDALREMNLDLVSEDNCPDMIVLNTFFNVEGLAENGVFADLSPYLAQSSRLDREDYPENLLECFTYNGVLTGIPLSFSLDTIAGRGTDVGEKSGWTVAEMLSYGREHPEASLFGGVDRHMMFRICLRFGMHEFVDETEGKCNFNTDTFKTLLQTMSELPDISQEVPTPGQIQSGTALLYQTSIREYQDIQVYEAVYDGDMSFIGYPTADGSNGCVLMASNAYGIASQSENKEAAWEFIEFFLCEGAQGWGGSGLPGNTEHRLATAVSTEYARDSFGRLWLGTDGLPMEKNSGILNYNGMRYEYRDVTEEDIERLEALVDTAQAASWADNTIYGIIEQEAETFFQGQKTVDEVAEVIQNRVQLFLEENAPRDARGNEK